MNATGASDLAYILLALLMLSILINLRFIFEHSVRRVRKKIADKNAPNLVQKYCREQAQKSKSAHQNNQRYLLDKQCARIREAYLSIEAKALDRGEDSEAYWQLLSIKLKALLKIFSQAESRSKKADDTYLLKRVADIRELVSRSPVSPSAERVLSGLAAFEQACHSGNSDKRKIAEHSQKLDRLYQRLNSASHRKIMQGASMHRDYSVASHAALKRLKQSLEDAEAKVEQLQHQQLAFDSADQFQRNSNEMRDGVNRCQHQLFRIQDGQDRINNIRVGEGEHFDGRGVGEELAELSEQIQEESEREINRLRSIIKDQRNLILDLEENLSRMELRNEDQRDAPASETDHERMLEQEDKQKQAAVSLVKSQLKDAENCIDTLEKELESLRNKYKEQKNQSIEELKKEPLHEQSLKEMEQTIDHLRKETDSHKRSEQLHQSLMNYMLECLDASSVEDVSLSTYQTLNDLGWKVGLIVKGEGRNLDIDPEQHINNREKTLITNMQLDEVDARLEKNVVKFHHVNISGKLSSASGAIDPDSVTEVLKIIKATDKLLGKMKSEQKIKHYRRQIDESSNSIKKLAHEIDQSMDRMCDRTEQSVSSGFVQVQGLARAKGLSGAHIASFKNLEQQVLEEIQGEKKQKLKMKKKFLLILKALDNIS
ncbi:hypothetical protein [Agaribacterium haliotis]|uniref:hypothetical protein n=1 Tax=Agaribacterium haliotis TaxID=2013869 RepID=UPI000BB578C6|nr:hypothetical protein [Agaribacterium haliotis]